MEETIERLTDRVKKYLKDSDEDTVEVVRDMFVIAYKSGEISGIQTASKLANEVFNKTDQ